MISEYVVSVVQKLTIIIVPKSHGNEEYRAEVFDGGKVMNVSYGLTEDIARVKAVEWIDKHYEISKGRIRRTEGNDGH